MTNRFWNFFWLKRKMTEQQNEMLFKKKNWNSLTVIKLVSYFFSSWSLKQNFVNTVCENLCFYIKIQNYGASSKLSTAFDVFMLLMKLSSTEIFCIFPDAIYVSHPFVWHHLVGDWFYRWKMKMLDLVSFFFLVSLLKYCWLANDFFFLFNQLICQESLLFMRAKIQ